MPEYVNRVEFCRRCDFYESRQLHSQTHAHYSVDLGDRDSVRIRQQIRDIYNDAAGGCPCGGPTVVRLDPRNWLIDGQCLLVGEENALVHAPPWLSDRVDKYVCTLECTGCGGMVAVNEQMWNVYMHNVRISGSDRICDGDEILLTHNHHLHCRRNNGAKTRMRLAEFDWDTARWIMMKYNEPLKPTALPMEWMVGLSKPQAKWVCFMGNLDVDQQVHNHLIAHLNFGEPTGEPVIGVEKW